MALDAQINQIEVLTSFAVNLSNFSESVTGNSNAFITQITEKLSELRLTERKAEELCHQISSQRKQMFNDYAAIAASDNHEMRNRLLVALQDSEQKEREAKRCLSIIHQYVNVAHGAVIAMIDCTKQFNKDAANNAGKGISFLKLSQANLEKYKSNQK